jgi:cytochrome c
VSQAGASDANLASAKARAAPGASTFASRCASCHGERGEGKGYSPAILGPTDLPVYPRDNATAPLTTDPVQLQLQSQQRPPGVPSRSPFRNARDLFNYLTQHRPSELKELSQTDLWPLVTFMLLAHGSQVPPGGVTAENADRVEM